MEIRSAQMHTSCGILDPYLRDWCSAVLGHDTIRALRTQRKDWMSEVVTGNVISCFETLRQKKKKKKMLHLKCVVPFYLEELHESGHNASLYDFVDRRIRL